MIQWIEIIAMHSLLNYLLQLPEWLSVVLVFLGAVVVFFLGFRLRSLFYFFKNRKIEKNLAQDNEMMQKSLKKLWEEDKTSWEKKMAEIENEKVILKKQLDEYRKKLSGFSKFTFVSRKQKEFFYKILIENETLEQLLEKQIEKISKIENNHSKERSLLREQKKKFFKDLLENPTIKNHIENKAKQFPAKF